MDTNKLIDEIISMTCDDHCNTVYEECKHESCGIHYAITAIEEKAERDAIEEVNVEHHCDTCIYDELALDFEPCRSECVIDMENMTFSKWTPKESEEE